MRQDLVSLAAECVELRRALQDSQARRQVCSFLWFPALLLAVWCCWGQVHVLGKATFPVAACTAMVVAVPGTCIIPVHQCYLPPFCPLLVCAACCGLPATHVPLACGLLCLQEAEGLVGELGEVVQKQKLRMRGLAQERAEACARLQAMNPQVRMHGKRSCCVLPS